MKRESVEKIIPLPENFTAELEGKKLVVKGNGKQAERIFDANGISLRKENNSIVVVGKPASKRINALTNTLSSHVSNMINGLKAEYVYKLAIIFSHFPMNVTVKGKVIEINNFVGEKKPRLAKIVEGATVSIKGKDVVVKSNNKEAAGQTAANIENAAKVRGKDKRIYQDGIFIVEKAVQEIPAEEEKKEESK